MLKALAIKELRESAGLIAAAVVLSGLSLGMFMGWTETNLNRILQYSFQNDSSIPFVSDMSQFSGTLCFGLLAIGLGLKQSAWEASHNTYYYLLHLPVKRGKVFAIKLTVGILIIVGLLAVYILSYAWWAATPGKSCAPFEWSMTYPHWKLALILPLVYLGAFCSGIRPAKWFGTRLFPLAAAIYWAVLIWAAHWAWLYWPVAIIGYGFALVGIFYYTQLRDY